VNDEQQPGWVAPGSTPSPPPRPAAYPGYPPPLPYPAQQAYYPPQFRQAHKPGIVALRPLGLGDLYDGAFTAIRRNPKPMVGLSLIVVTAFLALPALVTVALATTGDMRLPSLDDPQSGSGADPATIAALVGSMFGWVAGIILAGMLVFVVAQAVLGRKATVEETWRNVRGQLLRLIGLAVVSALMVVFPLVVVVLVVVALALSDQVAAAVIAGILGVLAWIAYAAFVQVRLIALAAPALVLERLRLFASMRRAYELSRGQFWRLLGITLLTFVITSVIAQLLAIPFAIVGVVAMFVFENRTTAAMVYVFSNYLSLVLTQAVTIPFGAGVKSLLYVDQRIRKEAYDVELIAQTQPAPSAY
jgi:hypothetical protein